ncbi:MAG: FtsW/RodA/SpoVE family cell cycle protein [Victivallaceae bacterium]|nr:putative peptidoglycan glycosyltransferase FtsW [Victivallaceae bacterium]
MRSIIARGGRIQPITGDTRADEIIDPAAVTRVTAYACGLVITTAAILLFGLTMLYSATFQTDGTHYFYAQLMWMAVTLCVGIGMFAIGYRMLAEYSPVLLFLTGVLLVAAVVFYPPINGAYRWLKFAVGGISVNIQPSELVKVFLPLYVGKYCADNFRTISSMFARHGAWFPVGVTVMMCGLVVIGRDLGTTLLIFSASMLILFVAGLRLRWYVFPLLGAVGLFFLIKAFDPMRWARLTSFLDPELHQEDTGYQLWNSIMALGSGSWTGLGFMAGRFKAAYLPEKHTDFILAVIGEELGLIGLIAVIVAYMCFTFFALKISFASNSRQGLFTGVGITFTVILQALINIGVVSGALPTKGIPAPLLSYGGSSLMMCGMALAVLLNIAADTASPDINARMWRKIFGRKKA